MIGLLCFVLAVLTSLFKSKLRLEAENAALRHQLVILRRKLRGRPRLTVKRRRGHVARRMSSNVLKEIEKASSEWGHDRRRC